MFSVSMRVLRICRICAAVALFVLATSFLAYDIAVADQLKDRMEVLAGSNNPVGIEADKAVYDRNTGLYTATGNVRISQGTMVLSADEATLDMNTGQAEARGRVTLADRENVLLADNLSVNFDTSLGVIDNGRIFVKKENYHIKGERLERISGDEYRVLSGSLTTCDSATPFWRVTADDIDVRMDKDVRAKNVVVRIKEVPVLYSPYAWFPLLKPRTTGFLIPGVGFSSDDGFRLFNSFYWAPADNFDATFSVDYRSKRGVGLSSEFRLALDPESETRLYGYYMDDRKDFTARYDLDLKHRQVLFDRLNLKADVNLSDREFYKDLADATLDRTKRSIDSNVFVTDVWDSGMAYLFSQYTLGLDVNRDVVVQRVPEAGFNLVSKRINDSPFFVDAEGSGAYFTKKRGVSGSRFDLYPKLTGVFNLGGVSIVPRVGYRETIYGLSGVDTPMLVIDPVTGLQKIDPVTDKPVYRHRIYDDERGLFGSGVTLQTELSRLYNIEGEFLKALKHTIEPKLAYNYVLARGGTRFPKFDGVDTLGRRSMVAYGLTNRFVFRYQGPGGETKLDYMTVKLGQFYDYFKDIRVSGVHRHFSSLYGEVMYMASYGLTLKTDLRYDFYGGTLLSVNTDLKYEQSDGLWHLLLGQRFSSDTDQTFMSPSRFDFFTPSTDFMSEFIEIENVVDEDTDEFIGRRIRKDERQKVNFLLFGGGFNLPSGLSVAAKVWYDIHTDSYRETDVSAGYESQCWGVRAEFVRRPGEKQIMVMLTFKGIGAVKI